MTKPREKTREEMTAEDYIIRPPAKLVEGLMVPDYLP